MGMNRLISVYPHIFKIILNYIAVIACVTPKHKMDTPFCAFKTLAVSSFYSCHQVF
jgi:hypothetical protein